MRSAHKITKGIKCRLCGQEIRKEEDVRRHMESVHRDVARGDGVMPVGELRVVITDHMQQLPPTEDENMNNILRDNWSFIKTKLKRGAVINMLNVCLWDSGVGVEG